MAIWVMQNYAKTFFVSQKIIPSFDILVKFWNPATKIFIARVGRENEKIVTSSMCLLTEMESKACRVRVLHVGGTLEKVESKYKDLTEAWL